MKDVLVGENYFAGWWKPLPNKWTRPDGTNWQKQYPARVPLLGQFNDQRTMDKEIDAAAEHGVDFFSILWYFNDPGKEREPNARFLSRGLNNFMSSPEAHRMRFMIEFCNHPPFQVETDTQWSQCLDTWLAAFRHPSYLRVGGRLVFKIHGGHFFLQQNGGDLERARAQLDTLRGAVRQAGLGEMLIGCGVGGGDEVTSASPYARLFDFTATYMDVPGLPPAPAEYPYDALSTQTDAWRKRHLSDAIPYVPYAPAGWNPRPWNDPRPCFALPNAHQWERELHEVGHAFDLSDRLGLPLPGGGRQKVFTIYAWNEFGEGGIVAPTRGDGYMKLDAIRKVFGRARPGARQTEETRSERRPLKRVTSHELH